MSNPIMNAADIQAMAYADFDLWASMQDEETQELPLDEQAFLYGADEAWHLAVDEATGSTRSPKENQ